MSRIRIPEVNVDFALSVCDYEAETLYGVGISIIDFTVNITSPG